MDNDLYNAPKSELMAMHDSYRPSHAWKLYFLLWVPLNVWATYDSWMHDRNSEPLLYWIISLPVYTIFFIGLAGLSFRFRVSKARFWSAFLPVLIAVDVYDLYSAVFSGKEDLPLEGQITMVILAIPLCGLGWFAMHCYARFVNLQSAKVAI